MADLLSSTDKKFFSSVMGDIFDTFKREIIVHKEPQKIVANVNVDGYHGYGESSNKENVTYIPVSESFYAMISYKDDQKSDSDVSTGIEFSKGIARIKVEQGARDYIVNGDTMKVDIDGRAFKLVTDDSLKYYFGTKYYVFFLEVEN
tara:strand:- start:1228 stop:1668 length:441 start_codon:yes stop_codon:yes gene_type:complete